jgi:hypothetical protein
MQDNGSRSRTGAFEYAKLRLWQERNSIEGRIIEWAERKSLGGTALVLSGVPYVIRLLTRWWYEPWHEMHEFALPLLVTVSCGVTAAVYEHTRKPPTEEHPRDRGRDVTELLLTVTLLGGQIAAMVAFLRWIPAACALAYCGLCELIRLINRRRLERMVAAFRAEYRVEIDASGYDRY